MTDTPSPRAAFGFRFVLLARAWRRELDHVLAGIGLTDATWAPLVHLDMLGDGISQKDLAWRVGIDGSSLVRLLDILARRGLIERRADPQDRRAKRIHLTEQGRAVLGDIRRTLAVTEDAMLDGLSDRQIAATLDLFDHVGMRLRERQDARQNAGLDGHQDEGKDGPCT